MTRLSTAVNKLTCPRCGGDLVATKDSRPHIIDGVNFVRRARVCEACNCRSHTLELTEASFAKLKADLRAVRIDADIRVNTAMAALKIFAEASQS